MENANNEFETVPSSPEADESTGEKQRSVSIKISAKTLIVIAAVILVGVGLFYCKSLFISATVDGSPVSRIAVIRELERVSGTSALDSLVNQKLILGEARKNKMEVSSDEVETEINKIEAQVSEQGKTMDEALAEEGMELDGLKKQIVIQKTLEKLLADKIQVSENEISQYISDNGVAIPAGQEAKFKELVGNQLKQEKLNQEADSFVSSLRAQADIQYFAKYYRE